MSGILGYSSAFGAAVAFGIQYVPVKRYEIYDGATFQWFMCSGILLIGFLLALWSNSLEQGCSRVVILGGALWALSNYAVLPLVKLLGIGLGFSLYHFVNLIAGYAVGRWGLFGVPPLEGHLRLCDAGCFLILISFIGMIFVETDESVETKPMRRRPSAMLQKAGSAYGLADQADAMESQKTDTALGDMATAPIQVVCVKDPPTHLNPRRRRLIGVVLAVVAGLLCGVQSVPATLQAMQNPMQGAMGVVFPQCLGIWVASTAIYWIYAVIAKVQGNPVPHAPIRPAFASGCLWTVGFVLMIGGIHSLGYSVGYTLDAVGPICVSSLISILYFKEISGRRQVSLFAGSFLLQLTGVVLIGVFGGQSEG